ncbi:hypothetical protein, partial [Stenotrophomonas sp. A3_2]|uniref:hypothetical protein n=1 Tax=Stenotrophomonas sp. A3_2 TaxID=3119978 RepID=UPI002FC313E2
TPAATGPGAGAVAAAAGAPVMGEVNLVVNAGAVVTAFEAAELRHLATRIGKSGLFTDVAVNDTIHPVTLRLDLAQDCSGTLAEGVGAVASSATLFIIPHPETCVFTLRTR